MSETFTILIVEDDANIADIVAYNLKKEGYNCLCAPDGEAGLAMYRERHPDLLLLDVMLPGIDGFEICRRIRETDDVPIVMLTAREGEDDKVTGLDLGADDYVVKPFMIRELLARVRANLRRVAAKNASGSAPSGGGVQLDVEKYALYIDGRPVDLTAREFEMFRFMCESPDKVFTREDLMKNVWGYDFYGDQQALRAVDVAVTRMRDKLKAASESGKKYVHTRRGVGYFYSENEI